MRGLETLYVSEAHRTHMLAQAQALDGQIRDIINRDKTATKSGSADNGVCWDDGDREVEILKTKRDGVLSILSHAKITPVSQGTSHVAIGLKVTFQVIRGTKRQTKCYVIGGFEETDLTANPPVASYDCPCVKAIMGKKVGETADFVFPNKEEGEVKVLKIEYP